MTTTEKKTLQECLDELYSTKKDREEAKEIIISSTRARETNIDFSSVSQVKADHLDLRDYSNLESLIIDGKHL